MGSWGARIFEDDLACDVRDTVVELAALGFAPADTEAELALRFGAATDLDESTYWIARALTEHGLGRLSDEVRAAALVRIDSGRALEDWVALTDPGDRSVAARRRHLQRARDQLAGPARRTRRPKIDDALRSRIDARYTPVPWREHAVYAYRTPQHGWFALAAVAVREVELQRHYVTTDRGYAVAPPIVLRQVALLQLDYHALRPPTPDQARALPPAVVGLTPASRAAAEVAVDAMLEQWRAGAAETFEAFSQGRDAFAAFTDAQFRQRYDEYHATCVAQVARLGDREAAIRRQHARQFSLDPRAAAPLERLVDLGVSRAFEPELVVDRVTWAELDRRLADDAADLTPR